MLSLNTAFCKKTALNFPQYSAVIQKGGFFMSQNSAQVANHPTPKSGYGILRLRSFAARQAGVVPEVTITIKGDGIDQTVVTDEEGITPDILLPAPSAIYSLDPDNTTVLPYSTVNISASAEGFYPVNMLGVQIFDGQITLAQLQFTPANQRSSDIFTEETIETPPHHLFNENQGGSGITPRITCTPFVLELPIIPEYITVHLGKPSASAKNVTVSFRHYIANVASSEVYPTWERQNKPIFTILKKPTDYDLLLIGIWIFG